MIQFQVLPELLTPGGLCVGLAWVLPWNAFPPEKPPLTVTIKTSQAESRTPPCWSMYGTTRQLLFALGLAAAETVGAKHLENFET